MLKQLILAIMVGTLPEVLWCEQEDIARTMPKVIEDKPDPVPVKKPITLEDLELRVAALEKKHNDVKEITLMDIVRFALMKASAQLDVKIKERKANPIIQADDEKTRVLIDAKKQVDEVLMNFGKFQKEVGQLSDKLAEEWGKHGMAMSFEASAEMRKNNMVLAVISFGFFLLAVFWIHQNMM
ncbi:unnamed protein product [Lymnaea stagnalis]|uniref:Uncharacterized protein n=1 Tax=Lymnaea stagnalis TaxID=6523 RepID=A0AAV2I2N6_LYMST